MKNTLTMLGAAALVCALPTAGTATAHASGAMIDGLGFVDGQAGKGNRASRQTSRTGNQSQRQTSRTGNQSQRQTTRTGNTETRTESRNDIASDRTDARSDVASDRTDARSDFAQDNWRGYYAARPVGYRVAALPASYTRVVIAGSPYFYHSGIYYTSVAGGYVVVAAPVGARIAVLPAGYRAVVWQGSTYYYVNDTYYTLDSATNAYVVVRKPAGIVVVK
ncbi:DUF6515 family protein [Sphingomonas sp.]|uniref:DUF6515 family protein n=1 Tax=Sphingomonas sp. TaxID=28214 RepID=UPI0018325610|nr:DUF6515 family protein [Sphingomonas sp.]MBA4763321.1 hypothetical protein [Sphingomonas sp.]